MLNGFVQFKPHRAAQMNAQTGSNPEAVMMGVTIEIIVLIPMYCNYPALLPTTSLHGDETPTVYRFLDLVVIFSAATLRAHLKTLCIEEQLNLTTK